jgi:peptidoglycan hydrolase CwlO-like protein
MLTSIRSNASRAINGSAWKVASLAASIIVVLLGSYFTYVVSDVQSDTAANASAIHEYDVRQRAIEQDMSVVKTKVERIESEQAKGTEKLDRILEAVTAPPAVRPR